MPTCQLLSGPRVPDLARIAEDWWAEVLAALPRSQRWSAAEHPGLGGYETDAWELVASLPTAASDVARKALAGAPSIPVPGVERRGRGCHLNVRLAKSEFDDLLVAAGLLGAKPTQIARMLVLNGVRRVLAEHDAAIARRAPRRYIATAMYFVSRYSSMPSGPPSRPKPEALIPPKGAAGLETSPWLSPIMPVWRFSQTRNARLRLLV